MIRRSRLPVQCIVVWTGIRKFDQSSGKHKPSSAFHPGVFVNLSIHKINNKIFLQAPAAKEALNFYSVVEQAFLSYSCLLVIFIAMYAHCVLVNSNEAACLAL
jgi:hypothetical protein